MAAAHIFHQDLVLEQHKKTLNNQEEVVVKGSPWDGFHVVGTHDGDLASDYNL